MTHVIQTADLIISINKMASSVAIKMCSIGVDYSFAIYFGNLKLSIPIGYRINSSIIDILIF